MLFCYVMGAYHTYLFKYQAMITVQKSHLQPRLRRQKILIKIQQNLISDVSAFSETALTFITASSFTFITNLPVFWRVSLFAYYTSTSKVQSQRSSVFMLPAVSQFLSYTQRFAMHYSLLFSSDFLLLTEVDNLLISSERFLMT